VALFRSSEDRKARQAGVDEARIPPGQYYTDKWPVLQAGSVPRVDLATWDFRAFGLVKQPIRLSFDSKAERGYRLAGHDATASIKARYSVTDTGNPAFFSPSRRLKNKLAALPPVQEGEAFQMIVPSRSRPPPMSGGSRRWAVRLT